MTTRALSFGSVASAYERYRPGYPDRLVDKVLAYAGRPVRTAVEIGAGTGKATRVFARPGIAVTASEPDAAMLAELRGHVPASVTVVRASLEDLKRGQQYDLVFVAAALHWTDPVGRWPRIAGLLHPAGFSPRSATNCTWPTLPSRPPSVPPGHRSSAPPPPTTCPCRPGRATTRPCSGPRPN